MDKEKLLELKTGLKQLKRYYNKGGNNMGKINYDLIKTMINLINQIEKENEGNLNEKEKETIEKGKKMISEYFASDDALLPRGFEWCRKAKYEVQIELGCYKIDEEHPLLEGFIEQEFNGEKYAIKQGINVLEKNIWKTNPDRPYIITGTVFERWPVKPSNLTAYIVEPENIGVEPITISTKDPSDQEFLVAYHIPCDTNIKVVTKWAFREDGTLDESQVLTSNDSSSAISHGDGDYVVAKHIDGKPEYMELPEDVRNTKEMATLYSPRIINGSVMATTYDHAETKQEIKKKYESSPKTLTKKNSD